MISALASAGSPQNGAMCTWAMRRPCEATSAARSIPSAKIPTCMCCRYPMVGMSSTCQSCLASARAGTVSRLRSGAWPMNVSSSVNAVR